MKTFYALKFFTKTGFQRVLPMPSEAAAYKILDDMRVNGAVLHVGKRCHRYDEMESIWIDDKQVFPMRLTQPISLDMGVRR